MKNRYLHVQKEPIPKSAIKKFCKDIRSMFNYLKMKSSISNLFYYVRIFFIFYEIVWPCFLPMDPGIWVTGEFTSNIMYFLTLFCYFGGITENRVGIFISFAVAILIFLVIFVLNIVASYIYKLRGRLHPYFMQFLVFCNDILVFILSSYCFAQMGTMIGYIAFVEFDAAMLICFLFLVLVILLLDFLLAFFYYPSVMYNPVSTTFWISSDNVYITAIIGAVNFFARLSEKANGVSNLVFKILFLIVLVLATLYFCLLNVFIRYPYNGVIKGFMVGGFIIAVIQSFQLLDQDVVFLFSILLLLISVVISNLISGAICKRVLANLDYLYDNPEDIVLYVKNRVSLTIMLRIGIVFGHPYIFSIQPFKESVVTYPRSKLFWEHYLRFVAIYPEENLTMMTILEEMKDHFRDNQMIKTLRNVSSTILQSRNRHMSTVLKRKIKEFDETTRLIKSVFASYWTAISEGSTIASYDIARQVMNQREELKSQYMHQLSLYPNNWLLCSHFSKNLKVLFNSQTEFELWSSRAQAMRKSEHVLDRCHIRGIQSFPNLPNELSNYEEKGNRIFFGGSVASKSSLSNSNVSTSSNFFDENEILNEEQKSASENVRLMGLKAPIPFISIIIGFTLIIFIVYGVIFPYIPQISYIIALNSLNHFYLSVYDSSGIAYSAGRIFFFLSLEVGRIHLPSIFLTEEADFEFFQIERPIPYYASNLISLLADNFSLSTGNFLQDMTNTFDGTEAISQEFFVSQLSVLYPGSDTYTKVSVPDFLSYLSSQLFGYNETTKDTNEFLTDDWFIFTMDNIITISTFMINYSKDLYTYVMDSINNSLIISEIITIVLNVVLFLISLAFYPLLIQVKKKWEITIKAFSNLPKSSIHQTNSLFTGAGANLKISGEERLFIADFMTMRISRDSRGGLPVKLIGTLYIFFIVLAIVSSTLLFYTSNDSRDNLVKIPIRCIILREAEIALYYTATIYNLYLASINDHQITKDDTETLYEKLIQEKENLRSVVNGFLIGDTDGSNYGLMSIRSESVRSNFFRFTTLNMFNMTYHTYIENLPDNVFVNTLEQYIEDSITYASLNNTENDFHNIINHILEQHLDDVYDVKYSIAYSSSLQTQITSLILRYTLFPLIFIAAELTIVCCIIYLLHQIRKTVRFCLSTLSYIDSSIVAQSQELSTLLSGQFNLNEKQPNSSSRTIIDSVPNFSPEFVIILEKDHRISFVNSLVETKWNLKYEECIDVDLDLILRFEDPSLKSKLDMLFKGDIDEVIIRETSAIIISTEASIPVSIYIIPVKHGNEVKQAGFIIVDMTKIKEQNRLLENERREALNLKRGMYPKSISKEINFAYHRLIFVSKRFTLVSIQLCNFESILKEEDPPARLTCFRKRINEAANEIDGAELVKSLGTYEFILFDVEKSDDPLPSNTKAIEFCRKLSKLLEEDKLVPRFGLTSETKCPMGMMDSNRMSFDVFGRCMTTAMLLVAAASPNCICVDLLESNSIQSIVNTQLTQKQVSSKGTKFIAFEYQL